MMTGILAVNELPVTIDTSSFATQTWVTNQLKSYATTSYVDGKVPDLSPYATRTWVTDQLKAYPTTDYVDGKIPDLNGYATEQYVDERIQSVLAGGNKITHTISFTLSNRALESSLPFTSTWAREIAKYPNITAVNMKILDAKLSNEASRPPYETSTYITINSKPNTSIAKGAFVKVASGSASYTWEDKTDDSYGGISGTFAVYAGFDDDGGIRAGWDWTNKSHDVLDFAPTLNATLEIYY